NRLRQNLHLVSDGELLIPPDDPQPLDYPNMMQQLESYHINAHDLRFFYYFPLLISANRYLQELVNREGGEIREHYEADLCTQSVTLYQDYRILLSVKDHHLHPFPAVTIRSPRIKTSHLTDLNGRVVIPIRSPSHFWYPFTLHHTGYADTYTHAYIDTLFNPQDTIRLVSIMMTPIPITINFNVLDQAQTMLPSCSLILESPRRSRHFFLERLPAAIPYYDYTPQTDSIQVTIKHPDYQPRSLPLHFNPNQNDYLLIVEMEKIRL
ncbi:MAG: hypothetical protein KBA26_14565, partial [Candidatus Delongbacteria bacterium]|nr:hypothetical protein [Candidatus Delongbacteria bacterium]